MLQKSPMSQSIISVQVQTLAGNSRGLGDFSWLSKKGMMRVEPEPWELYPTLSYDPTASYVKTQPLPWSFQKGDDNDVRVKKQGKKSEIMEIWNRYTFTVEATQNVESIIRKEAFIIQGIWEQLGHSRAAHLFVMLMLIYLHFKTNIIPYDISPDSHNLACTCNPFQLKNKKTLQEKLEKEVQIELTE